MLHLIAHHRSQALDLLDGALEIEFVVHLQDHTGGKALGTQARRNAHHRDLDDVRRRTLHRVIHCRALAKTPELRILALELGDMATAAKHRLGIPDLLRLRHHSIKEGAHARIRLEVTVDHLARLGHGNVQRLREPICLLPIHDAEVDRLGAAPELGRDLFHRHAEHARGGLSMEILALVERCDQMLIGREMRKQPQLDLTVVDRKEDRPLTCRKRRLDRMTELGARRDVLQVGVARRKTARSGDGLVVRGVHASVSATQRP